MGCFDTVKIPCPNCGKIYTDQSKSGPCNLKTYSLSNVPLSVIGGLCWDEDIFTCSKCNTKFKIVGSVWTEEIEDDEENYLD